MPEETNVSAAGPGKSIFFLVAVLLAIGGIAFLIGTLGAHPEHAWQTYLINFLLWSAIAQGAVLFSAVMHMTKARWSGPLAGLSEAFTAFFPLSFALFLLLFLGRAHIFPWLYEDLHGKEIWLNIPFLFWRDFFGLLILYLLGFAYLYNALQLKFDPTKSKNGIRKYIYTSWNANRRDVDLIKKKMTTWGGLYILAFALVLSLIGYDLIMSMDPHWISTLFGAYHFVKAFYLGLGGLIILASLLYIKKGKATGLTESHFHDIGKLFFAFCLLWADFFYVQLVVIWYGNIPEETYYVITRSMLAPWNVLAWSVFGVCFVLPFFILLNKSVKTKPVFMIVLCSVVIIGIWFEHLLLLGPALSHGAGEIQLRLSDGLISLGVLGLMVMAVSFFLRVFPEIIAVSDRRQVEV
jgi:hypothetical protein